MILLAFTLTFIGFLALSLSMKRHFLQYRPQHINTSLPPIFLFRIIGYLLLIFAATLCMVDQGVAVGLVFWVGLITLAALLQSLLLTYRPQWIMPIGLLTSIASAVVGVAN